MDEVIWVEVLSRQRDVVARHRFAGPEVRVGRGYGNDVVIDDPYVALEHLRIRRGDDRTLVAEDIGTLNGMFADHSAERVQRVVLDGDRLIRIGRTYLRIRSSGYVLPRERALAKPPRTVPIILALGVVLIGISALSLWFRETSEPRLSRYIPALLEMPVYALIWATIWAILCRIFAGQARFDRQLLIALVGLLTFTLYGQLSDFAPFAISWYAPGRYEFTAGCAALAGVCFSHLREIGPARLKLKGGIVAGIALVVMATQWLVEAETRADYGQQVYARHLLPAAFRLMPFRDEAAFFGDVEKLKGQLDRDRKKQPSATDTAVMTDQD